MEKKQVAKSWYQHLVAARAKAENTGQGGPDDEGGKWTRMSVLRSRTVVHSGLLCLHAFDLI